ncbi:MAG: hypothetical protein AB1611_14580 [bacterium]
MNHHPSDVPENVSIPRKKEPDITAYLTTPELAELCEIGEARGAILVIQQYLNSREGAIFKLARSRMPDGGRACP